MKRPLASQRIAVVGAGMAGLACARRLKRAGAQVVVFEAESRIGGRLRTLQTEAGPFDLGAQYFTVEHHAFERALAPLRASGAVEPWRGRIVALWRGNGADKTDSAERLVALPGMQSLADHFCRGLDLHLSQKVTRLEMVGLRWQVRCGEASPDDEGFDAVALALPAPRALELLPAESPLAAELGAVLWEPIWAVALAMPRRVAADFDGAFVNDDPLIAWIARDSSKPARPKIDDIAERWVIHGNPRWSREHFDMPEAEVVHWLSHAFAARVGRAMRPRLAQAFRWAQARPLNPMPRRCLWDSAAGLGVASDACKGARVEGAFLSGLALAESIVFE